MLVIWSAWRFARELVGVRLRDVDEGLRVEVDNLQALAEVRPVDPRPPTA
jgi:hypothetical protein